MPRRKPDVLIRNGRPTRQERLDRVRVVVDSTKTFEQAHKEALDKAKEKCLTCDKWTLYGKTCNGVCVKEDVEP